MRFCNSITAKVLVWLAAISVPAQALPAMACDCGSHSPRRAEVKPGKSGRADAAPAAKCPHCSGGSRPRHSCCGGTAASSTQHGSCCGAMGSCCGCCKGGLGSHGSPCQCSTNKSTPAPDPLPSDSRTDTTKSSLSTSSLGGMASVAILAPPAALAHADQQPTFLGSSAPERLSILCRLVI